MKTRVEVSSQTPQFIRLSLIVALASLAWGGTISPTLAQPAPSTAVPAAAPAPPRNPPSVYAEYHPSLSDQMTLSIQPRHTKLGLAIQAGNWTYAAYEAGELRGAFRRISQAMPGYEGKDTAMLMSMITPAADDLVAAIKAKDTKATKAAYASLTATCNSCHQALGRTYIFIREPTTAMYPDQDFSPH